MAIEKMQICKYIFLKFIFLVSILYFATGVTSSKNRCFDRDHRCDVWSRDGKCSNNDVKRDCPKSCETCSVINKDLIYQSLLVSTHQNFLNLLLIIGVVIIGVFVLFMRIYYCGKCCHSKGTLKGNTVIITGATSGIGLETAYHLAARGARIIIGCRSIKKGLKVAKDIRAQTGQDFIHVKKLNLASLDSVREFAQEVTEEFEFIDILINNAAVITSKKRSMTTDGFETTFQVNYLAHYLLTKLLIGKLKASAPSRIINLVSKDAFNKGNIEFNNLQGTKSFSNYQAYNNSKLALMLFTQEATNVLKGLGVTVNAVDPGKSCTSLWRNCFPYNFVLTWFFMKPYTYLFWKMADMGAEATYYCSLEGSLENVSGKYFKECSEFSIPAFDDEIARKLWEVSERLIQPKRLSTLNAKSIESLTANAEKSDENLTNAEKPVKNLPTESNDTKKTLNNGDHAHAD